MSVVLGGISIPASAGVLLVLPLRMHMARVTACHFGSTLALTFLGALLPPLWCEKATQGKIQRCLLVPIRTELGTMVVLVGSVLAVAGLWNFSCVKLGTMKNLQVLLVFLCQQFL